MTVSKTTDRLVRYDGYEHLLLFRYIEIECGIKSFHKILTFPVFVAFIFISVLWKEKVVYFCRSSYIIGRIVSRRIRYFFLFLWTWPSLQLASVCEFLGKIIKKRNKTKEEELANISLMKLNYQIFVYWHGFMLYQNKYL